MKCNYCEREFDASELNKINGEILCDDCRDEKYTQCTSCGKLIERDYDHSYDDEFYCEDCGGTYPIEDMIINPNGDYVCDYCYEMNYFVCDSCGRMYHQDDEYGFNNESYCEECYNTILDEHGIHEYDYKPTPIFYHTDKECEREKNLHIGIELEIQGDDRFGFCDNVIEEFTEDEVYLKLDGSLHYNGIEIVSMPMTKKYIFQDKMWKEIFKFMNDNEMNNTNGCGLHFHLDRNYLDKNAISTIDYVVNNFSEYFEQLGGRPFDECTSYFKKVNKESDKWGTSNFTRYTAVNLENDNTVELRFCQSTCDYNVFCERVKMVFALVNFANTYEFKDVHTWSKRKFLIRFKKCLVKN